MCLWILAVSVAPNSVPAFIVIRHRRHRKLCLETGGGENQRYSRVFGKKKILELWNQSIDFTEYEP